MAGQASAKLPGPGFMGNGVASAAVEAFTRHLAGELGAHGVRAICLRPHAVPQAMAARHGVAVEQLIEGMATGTLLKRMPTLDQVAEVAAFMASDGAGAMTGTVANLSCGMLVDLVKTRATNAQIASNNQPFRHIENETRIQDNASCGQSS